MKSLTRSLLRLTSTLALGALLSSGALASSVLLSQAPKNDGDVFVSAVSTQSAESFTLGTASSITAFRWWGTDINVSLLTVRFYETLAEVGGFVSLTPGSSLTKVATGGQGLCGADDGSVVLCDLVQFTLTLATPIAAQANRLYHLAVFAPDLALWGWQESTVGDGVSLVRGGDDTPWTIFPPDLSLAVIGDPAVTGVPEPMSLALVGLGLAAAAAARRRAA